MGSSAQTQSTAPAQADHSYRIHALHESGVQGEWICDVILEDRDGMRLAVATHCDLQDYDAVCMTHEGGDNMWVLVDNNMMMIRTCASIV